MEEDEIKVQRLIDEFKPKNKIIATDIEITEILFAGDKIMEILEEVKNRGLTSKDFRLWIARGKNKCLPVSTLFMDDVEIEEN